MKIIGCDFHPSFQQIAMCDLQTGEFQERKLSHADGQAERFYRELGEPALIGSRPLEIVSGLLIWCSGWAMRYG